MSERYITKIEVINFQSHKHSIIHPAPPGQLTVTCGPSDTGKSAFNLAMEWADLGNWESSYMRYGCKFTQVTRHYSDGYIVSIRRNKSGGTVHTITNPDGTVRTPMEGAKIPLEVQEITGVHIVDFGADFSFALNYQRQDAGRFMGKSISGPGRARILGSLAGTEEVDRATQLLRNALDKNRQEQKKLAGDPEKKTIGEIGELDAKLKEYNYLESLGQTIQEVESLLSQVRQDTELKTKLHKLNSDIITMLFGVLDEEIIINCLDDTIDKTTPILQTLDQQTTLHENLSTRFTRLTGIIADIKEQDRILDATQELTTALMAIHYAEKDVADRDRLSKLHSELQQTQDGIDQAETILTGTSHIDEAMKLNSLASDDNQTKSHLIRISDAYIQVTTALNEAGKVILLTENTEAAESILRSQEADSVKVLRLKDIFGQINQTHAALREVNSTMDATRHVSEGMSIISRTLEEAELYGKLVPLLERRWGIDHNLMMEEETIECVSGLEEAEKVLFESQKGMDLLAVFFGLQMRRNKVTETMEAVRQEIEETERRVTESQGGYVAALKEMGVCELCGSEVTEEGMRRVV